VYRMLRAAHQGARQVAVRRAEPKSFARGAARGLASRYVGYACSFCLTRKRALGEAMVGTPEVLV
jgi:hypothetical protein